MKIAICISGLLRNYKETFNYFNNFIIKDLKPDIFLFTDKYDKKCLDLYKPKDFGIQKGIIDDNYNFLNTHQSTIGINMVNNFYKISEVFKLKSKYELKNNFNYDLVIRCRFDSFFTEKINILNIGINDIIIPNLDFYVNGISKYAINDNFGIGSSSVMNIYSSIYDKLNLYKNDIIFHPETIIGYNLYINNINIIKKPIKFQFYHPSINEFGDKINIENYLGKELISPYGIKYRIVNQEEERRFYPIK